MNYRVPCAVLLFLCGAAAVASAETPPSATPQDMNAIKSEMSELRRQMDEQRQVYQSQIDDLKQQVKTLSQGGAAAKPAPASPEGSKAERPIALVREPSLFIGGPLQGANGDPLYQYQIDDLRQKVSALTLSVAAAKPTTQDELSAAIEQVKAEMQKTQDKEPSLFFGRVFQSMNPDISLVGDFLGHFDSRGSKADFGNQFLMREAEVGFSSDIDPYAKANVIISVSQDPKTGEFSPDIEEAYVTLPTLPYDFQAKVGRFLAEFGKTNEVHTHALPWVEQPDVIRRFFGDEGLKGDGFSVSHLIPNPSDTFIELTYQLFNTDNGILGGSLANNYTHLVHLKNFFDLTSESSLEVGLSAAVVPTSNGAANSEASVEGADVTYRWRPKEGGLYRSLTFQNEILASQSDASIGRSNAWGLYSSLEYQLSERWFACVRYDFTEMPNDPSQHESAGSLYLTFKQTEFCYWRIGIQQSVRNFCEFGSKDDTQAFVQLDFSLGVHPAHKY